MSSFLSQEVPASGEGRIKTPYNSKQQYKSGYSSPESYTDVTPHEGFEQGVREAR